MQTFADRAPRFRYLCCCIDCKQKLDWAAAQGGPLLPPEVQHYERPLDLVYFSNSLLVERGKELLTFNRLRDEKRSLNCVASCCHTVICIDHPGYRGLSLLVLRDVVQLHTTDPVVQPAVPCM